MLALAARQRRAHAALLSGLAFRTLILVVVPSWIVMRVGAQLIADKEFPDKTPGWVDVGFVVSEPGLIVLIALGVLAWVSARRGGVGRASVALAILAPVYLAALAVAWWAMSEARSLDPFTQPLPHAGEFPCRRGIGSDHVSAPPESRGHDRFPRG